MARDLVELAVLARRVFPRRGRPELEANEVQVLLALYVQPNRSATAVAEELLLAKVTVSHALSELQRRRLILDRPNPTDGRSRLQSLSNDGERLARQLAKELVQRVYTQRGS